MCRLSFRFQRYFTIVTCGRSRVKTTEYRKIYYPAVNARELTVTYRSVYRLVDDARGSNPKTLGVLSIVAVLHFNLTWAVFCCALYLCGCVKQYRGLEYSNASKLMPQHFKCGKCATRIFLHLCKTLGNKKLKWYFPVSLKISISIL